MAIGLFRHAYIPLHSTRVPGLIQAPTVSHRQRSPSHLTVT
jgi:hypothetical protein